MKIRSWIPNLRAEVFCGPKSGLPENAESSRPPLTGHGAAGTAPERIDHFGADVRRGMSAATRCWVIPALGLPGRGSLCSRRCGRYGRRRPFSGPPMEAPKQTSFSSGGAAVRRGGQVQRSDRRDPLDAQRFAGFEVVRLSKLFAALEVDRIEIDQPRPTAVQVRYAAPRPLEMPVRKLIERTLRCALGPQTKIEIRRTSPDAGDGPRAPASRGEPRPAPPR